MKVTTKTSGKLRTKKFSEIPHGSTFIEGSATNLPLMKLRLWPSLTKYQEVGDSHSSEVNSVCVETGRLFYIGPEKTVRLVNAEMFVYE